VKERIEKMKILIVGGVAGGASAAARLRRLDESAEIIMFERGGYISFANCGLPYYIGDEIKDRKALTLQTPRGFNAQFSVDVRVFSEVTEIDRAAKTVNVRKLDNGESYQESYDKLILSPGAIPFSPQIPGIKNEKVFTVRSIPDADRIKEFIAGKPSGSAAVIGGGYIGLETAENLKLAGLDVTIIEMADHIIASLDYDMASQAQNYLRKQGVGLILSNGLTAIEEKEEKLYLKLDKPTGEDLLVDFVIFAAGVRPDTGLAKAAGLALGESGAIAVNEAMLTSDENIYAVGDAVEINEFVTGKGRNIPLAGPANKQGRVAADNIHGIHSKYKGTQGSAVIKLFDMTVAATGISEATAKKQGLDYDKVFTLSASHATYYPGAKDLSVKTIFEKTTGRILGAQIVGYEGVDKRCDVLATAIRAGMTAGELTGLELCYAPPYSSAKDPVNFAGYVAENALTGLVKNFQWHDADALPRDGSVILLDVRTPGEFENGHIDGFFNIELAALRDRLEELDKSKPVYVCCRSGQRSYNACRILAQNGFDCYNLSGGYWLYKAVIG